ncbi:MAG: DUF4956 domain-containing protein [Flavobacteriia bacterium]|nr:DUF4956 domain-containing protein [Flavobacteriia bacterium]
MAVQFTGNSEFYLRLLIDIVSCLVLIRLIYYPIYKNREFFFTFIIFNIIIFFITYLMKNVEMSMGAAFGLFAVFSMLRYRTEGLSMKDMTYLFLVIALGLITAIGMGTLIEITILNALIIIFTYVLESNLLIKKEFTKVIQYENIELIKPDKYNELKLDLENRTGLKITRIVVDRIDFLRDTALLTVHYNE